MSKQCELTGVKISLGNNVSHAHNKTKRSFIPNLQKKSIYSDILNQMVRLKISTKAIKSIESAGGFDKYIISIPNNKLSIKALKFKKAIKVKIAQSPNNKKKTLKEKK
jgi:large subunit ribosomal protein L28